MSEDFAARVGRALGASRSISLNIPPCGGPLDLLQLRAIVAGLREQSPTVDCHLSLSRSSWSELVSLAAELQSEGQEISPSELARVLLERGVNALRESRSKPG